MKISSRIIGSMSFDGQKYGLTTDNDVIDIDIDIRYRYRYIYIDIRYRY